MFVALFFSVLFVLVHAMDTTPIVKTIQNNGNTLCLCIFSTSYRLLPSVHTYLFIYFNTFRKNDTNFVLIY